MTQPNGPQRIVPMLAYDDAPAAIEFLRKAFGFEERFRFDMPDGKVGHAELVLCDNVVMLASAFEEFGFSSPQNLSAVHSQLFCTVDDVDVHYARARAAGATIVAEPGVDHGTRRYRSVDPEGARWIFATPVDPD